MDEKKNTENQRIHYRIVYPSTDRPKFKGGGHVMDIFDVSEQGIAMSRPAHFVLAKGQVNLAGKIEFQDGESVAVSGKILRTSEDTIILILTKGIPFATIMNQQRQMLKKYGTLT